MGRERTLAELVADGDDLGGVSGTAGLVGAVADAEGEVLVGAEAADVVVGAAEGGGLGEHAVHASLLWGVR